MRIHSKYLKDASAQSLVEFAIIVPILIVIIFGIIDFGRLFYYKSVINNTTKELARMIFLGNSLSSITGRAKVLISPLSDSLTASTETNVDDQGNPCTKIILSKDSISVMTGYITPAYTSLLKPGDTVRVKFIYRLDYITPLKALFGSAISLSSTYYIIIESPPPS